jgi:hypothetical protein
MTSSLSDCTWLEKNTEVSSLNNNATSFLALYLSFTSFIPLHIFLVFPLSFFSFPYTYFFLSLLLSLFDIFISFQSSQLISFSHKHTPCSLGLSATSQQYFSLRTNQPPATSQQCFSLTTNQHQSSATSQTNRLTISVLE